MDTEVGDYAGNGNSYQEQPFLHGQSRNPYPQGAIPGPHAIYN